MLDNYIFDGINSALTKLLNQKLQGVGRVANMLWLCFGDEINSINLKGEPVVKYKYALHIQCNWEIIDGDKIILNQDDFYRHRDEMSIKSFDFEDFDDSRFDEFSASFNSIIKVNPVYVSSFEIDIVGGFSLLMDNNYLIRVHPYGLTEGESWRFLMADSSENHFVVFEDDF